MIWTFYISSLSSYPVSSTTKPIINASTYVLVGCFILRNAIQCVENLRDTRHLSELHRKHVKNVDFNKQMFPGINENEQGRIRARFSLDVTKRCNAEIKQARLSRHLKWIFHQEVSDPEQFYVHIFQMSDSYSQLHLYGLNFQCKVLDDLDILHFFP
jgi:hypothetical protein